MNARVLCTTAALILLLALLATAASASDGDPNPALRDPSLASATAPDSYRVKMATTKGDFVIEVTRAWAPNGADRFYNLVRIGYYDGTKFFRVVDGFMAQVGMHGDPVVQAAWSKASIPDDPVIQNNTRGMVTFAAKGSPNSRTTQFFINFVDNSYLTRYGAFAPFGRIVEGMDVVDSLYTGYGEGAPQGRGPSQGEIARRGNAYLEQSFPKLDAIVTATLVDQ